MRRTATHIISSPNPAQLEMRILANYGGDRRFAFLRGRWARAWTLEKEKVATENAAKIKAQNVGRTGASLGVLANYGDSDADESEDSDKIEESPMHPKGGGDVIGNGSEAETDAAVKELRRARAREWSKKRRTLTSSAS